jgi:hypothetical protein
MTIVRFVVTVFATLHGKSTRLEKTTFSVTMMYYDCYTNFSNIPNAFRTELQR